MPGFSAEKSREFRQRYELLKGIIEYDIYTSFPARRWQVRKSLKSLDEVLVSTLKQQNNLQNSRAAAPQRFEGFNQQIVDQKTRITQLKMKVRSAFEEQKGILQEMVDAELDSIRLRLVDYLDQARFSLAHIQDLATNAGKFTEDSGEAQ